MATGSDEVWPYYSILLREWHELEECITPAVGGTADYVCKKYSRCLLGDWFGE